MYKKISGIMLALLVTSPVLSAFVIGYPLARTPHTDLSQRCFKVGEWGEFMKCFDTGRVMKGIRLINQISRDVYSFSPVFALVLVTAVVISLAATLLLALQGKTVEEKKLQHPVNKKK